MNRAVTIQYAGKPSLGWNRHAPGEVGRQRPPERKHGGTFVTVLRVATQMSNPDNYSIVKSPAKDRSRGAIGTSLSLRKRGAANWSLLIPDAAFDSGSNAWEERLTATVKRSGESVEFPAKVLERLRAEASRILHPTVKAQRFDRD